MSDLYFPDLAECGRTIEIADVKKTPNWNTEEVRYETGFVQRNRVRVRPLISFELRLPLISDAQYLEILNFLHQHAGAFEAFWFQDWTDVNPTARVFSTADGATMTYKLPHDAMDACTIYVDGVLDVAAAVDLATGVVTFPAAPAEGAVLTYTATNVRYRARFASDELPTDVHKFANWHKATVELDQVAIGDYSY